MEKLCPLSMNCYKIRGVLESFKKKKHKSFLFYFEKSRFLLIIEHFFDIFSQQLLSIFDNIIRILKSNTQKSTNTQFLCSFFFLILSLFYAIVEFFTFLSFLSYLWVFFSYICISFILSLFFSFLLSSRSLFCHIET